MVPALVPARQRTAQRCGAVLVMAAACMILIFAFTAFVVDVGYITTSKADLQKAADAAAMAAALELSDGLGLAPSKTPAQVASAARAAAVEVAAANQAASRDSVYADANRDVRLGQHVYDSVTGTWATTWGVSPYNVVEVTLRRDQSNSINGDEPLNLFFAPVIGHKQATITAISRVAVKPGVGFRTNPGQKAMVLPIALDEDTWNNLQAGYGDDDYEYDHDRDETREGMDNVLEVNLYPSGSSQLPPGNRGTVDFGGSNNSTADLSRQILEGLDDADLTYFGGELRFDGVPLVINGDTGLSAGIKDELQTIIGEPRAIPIFSEVSGNGNNANYTIVKFVGIRVLNVNLTGKPSQKRVVVQPAALSDSTVIAGEIELNSTGLFTAPGFID